jgi:hypothetical protein
MPRSVHRADSNQKKIVKELRAQHFSVALLSMVGDDFPDLIIARSGFTACVELKSKRSANTWAALTDGQAKFAREWRGAVILGYTAEQIVKDFLLFMRRYIGGSFGE